MSKLRIIIATACIGGLAALGIQAAALAHGGGLPHTTRPDPMPPVLREPAPSMPRDLGLGERLILVTAGTYDSRSEAEAADANFAFGEIQGFYAVPISQFEGLATELNSDRPWVLVSAFRTWDGAEAFSAVAEAAGAQPRVSTARIVSLGGDYAGLGQEPAPDGSGPLTRATRASSPESA